MKYENESKKEVWRMIVKLRKQITEHPIGSLGLRQQLNKLLDEHQEWVRAEKEEKERQKLVAPNPNPLSLKARMYE